jgi:phosphoheptose isomerase
VFSSQEIGATTIALTGENGIKSVQVDHLLAIMFETISRIQEEHLVIIHC